MESGRIALLAVALSAVLLTLLACLSMSGLPLLDEQYIIKLCQTQSQSFNGFLSTMINWPGPQEEDSWGILAATAFSFVSWLPLIWIRMISVVLHIINAVLFYIVAREMLPDHGSFLKEHVSWVSAAAALLFVIYPLTPEAVSYVGGFAYLLGCAFLLISFIFYLRGKHTRNWTMLGVSWIAFLFAILSDSSLWSAGFIVVILELLKSFFSGKYEEGLSATSTHKEVFEDAVDRMIEHYEEKTPHSGSTEAPEVESKGEEEIEVKSSTKGSEPPAVAAEKAGALEPHGSKSAEPAHTDGPGVLFDSLVPALPFIILGALIPVGALPAASNEQLPHAFIASSADWFRVLKRLFLPINEPLTAGYARQYLFLYISYAIPGVVAAIAFVRSKSFRQNLALLALWLLVVIVPHLAHTLSDSSFTGSRWVYNACLPVAGILALIFMAPAYAVQSTRWARNKWATGGALTLSMVFVLLLTFSHVRRTYVQNAAFRTYAKTLSNLQTNAGNLARKEKSPFVFVRNVPRSLSMVPVISPYNVIMIDRDTTLARAYKVPGGQLKDALKAGTYRGIMAQWSVKHDTLVGVDLGNEEVPLVPESISATDVKIRLRPGIEFLKSVAFDARENLLILDSNAETGPIVTLDTYGLRPLGDDFIYVEAKIDTPKTDENARMELHWITNVEQEHQWRDRRTTAKVIVNDGQFHRYYLPVRSTGWSTNGQISHLTLGFPASAKVHLKELGRANPTDLIPMLTMSGSAHAQSSPVMAKLCYDYPQMPELGLVSINRKSSPAIFDYDVSNIGELAVGAILEISQPGRFFDEPNSDRMSIKPFKTIKLENKSGQIKLAGSDLKFDGVYSMRIFAVDRNGKPLANASDEFNCLVYTGSAN